MIEHIVMVVLGESGEGAEPSQGWFVIVTAWVGSDEDQEKRKNNWFESVLENCLICRTHGWIITVYIIVYSLQTERPAVRDRINKKYAWYTLRAMSIYLHSMQLAVRPRTSTWVSCWKPCSQETARHYQKPVRNSLIVPRLLHRTSDLKFSSPKPRRKSLGTWKHIRTVEITVDQHHPWHRLLYVYPHWPTRAIDRIRISYYLWRLEWDLCGDCGQGIEIFGRGESLELWLLITT